ncbi:MAG: 16S rRNA (cytidine(1402)-2'-O)-methyltransferase, partial [Verrucomicrobiales bacterium]
ILAELEPGRRICVARELTKKFEEFQRGSAVEVFEHFRDRSVKGEISLVISGSQLPKWMMAEPD